MSEGAYYNEIEPFAQCCGVCRWFVPSKLCSFPDGGRCSFTVPWWSKTEVWSLVDRAEGTDCPCFERKEGE